MNIEEIKERFKRYDFVHSYIDEYGCDDEWKDAHEPIGYLLSIIEKAEKAFEEINYQFELHEHDVIDDGIKKADVIAIEALQAIRK